MRQFDVSAFQHDRELDISEEQGDNYADYLDSSTYGTYSDIILDWTSAILD
jgi:hypothetical protein